MLDRMVGYSISPLLWAKVKRGLSAGRVQSVALRMICDREEEINAFIPEEYWNLDADLTDGHAKKPLIAKFHGTADGKVAIHNKKELDQILKNLENAHYVVDEVKHGERTKKPPIPFTTSTMQQGRKRKKKDATRYCSKKAMRLVPARRLFRQQADGEKL